MITGFLFVETSWKLDLSFLKLCALIDFTQKFADQLISIKAVNSTVYTYLSGDVGMLKLGNKVTE